MANNVIVNPSASYTVAAEDIGVSVEVQRVKVVIGTAGVDGGNVGLTNPMPVTGAVSAQVSGAVSVSAMPAVSISVSAILGTVGTVLGTVAVNVVAGGAGGGSVTTAPPSVSASGQLFWVAGGQSSTANPVFVSGSVAISGAVTAPVITSQVNTTGMAVWLAPTQTIASILSTVNVAIVAGAGGGGSVTTAVPNITATGQMVWVVGGQSTTAFPVVVTGTVTAGAGTTVVSIGNVVPVTTAASVSVTGLPVWLNPTQTVVVSGAISALTTAQASGVTGLLVWLAASQTMIISATAAFSTTALATTTQAAVTGAVVWLAPTQTVNATVNTLAAGFSVNALVTGVVSVSVLPAVSLSVSAVLGTVITILGTQVVSVVPGLSVLASISGVVPVTTAASVSVTGLPVWLNPTQGVNALVSGPVSISAMPAISVSVSAVLGTVVTLLGTVAVNVVAGALGGGSVTTAVPNITASGQMVWIVGGQSTTAFPVVVTGTVTAGAGTTVVSIGNVVPVTTAASVSVTGLPVWINPTAAIGTIVTVLGTAIVSVVPGLSVLASISAIVPVTTAASVSVSGIPVWLNPTQTVVVSGAVIGLTTAAAVAQASTALIVVAKEQVKNPFLLFVSSTVGLSAGSMYIFTVWTAGTQAAAGTSAYPVPAGQALRILNIQAALVSSAVIGGTVQIHVIAATATASMVSGSINTQGHPIMLQMQIPGVSTTLASLIGAMADITAGTTIGIWATMATSCTIPNIIVQGYIF